jgi:hypothetical protein
MTSLTGRRKRNCTRLKPSATNRGFCYSQVLTATVSLLGAGLVGGRHWARIHISRSREFWSARFRERHFRSGQLSQS